MQRFFLIIFFCMIFIANSTNAMTTNEYVNNLEKKLFGATYENLPIDSRIDKIEMQIYDNCYSGSPSERLEKIDKIYPKAEFEAEKISPKKSSNYVQEEYLEPEKSNYNNYPVISEIEQKIYNRNYQGEDIYKRLSRIEKELYGMEKSEQSLQDRVASLKSILPAKKESPFKEQRYTANDITFEKTNDSVDSLITVKELEKRTFDKTFDHENTVKRIERLEQFYFGSTAMGQTEEDRLSRLSAIAVSSKKNNYPHMNNIEWTNLLINLLFIGLGFLL